MTTPVAIAIAVVEHRGQFLVGQRPAGIPLAGLAEFPGGKLLPDESPEDGAVRECREETGLNVVAVSRFPEIAHDYAHGSVRLHFLRCRLAEDSLEALPKPAEPFRWVSREELSQLEFPAANQGIVAALVTVGWPGLD